MYLTCTLPVGQAIMAGPNEEGGEENGTGSRNSLNITRNTEVNGNRSVGDSMSP